MVLITEVGGKAGTPLLQALSSKGISTRAWIHRTAR